MVVSNFRERLFVLVGIFILHLRPAIPGQYFGSVYLSVTFVLLFLLFFLDRKIVLKKTSFFVIWYIFVLGYLLFSSMYSSESFIQGIKAIVIGLLPLFWYSSMTPPRGYWFLQKLINFFFFLTLSAIVTYGLIILFDMRFELLKINLGTIEGSTNYIFTLHFPFTFVYSSESLFMNTRLPRFICFFREPGIAQIMLISSYYLVGLFYKGKKFLIYKIVLFIGFFLTFSTAGFLGFFVSEIFRIFFFTSVGYRYRWLKRALFVILGVSAALFFYYLLFLSDFSFNIAAKLSRNSGASRIYSIVTAFDYLRLKPWFGHGFFSFSESSAFENVNLLTASSEIGILGFGLVIIGYCVVLIKSFKVRSVAFLIGINLFLLILLSQPIYWLPISFFVLAILFFLIYNHNDIVLKDHLNNRKVS